MSLDEIPEPTDEELAEMEAALDEVYGDSAYDQGDEFEFYDEDDWAVLADNNDLFGD